MKKFILYIKIALGTLVAAFIIVVLSILYPQNLFAHHQRYKSFTIYSKQKQVIKTTVLDNATELVKGSELYDSSYHYDIFLTEKHFIRSLYSTVLGPTLAQSIDNNIMLHVSVDFNNNLLYNPYNKRNLTETIAHEMVHCLQLNKYGMFTFNPINGPQTWIAEGYAEYIAAGEERSDPNYDFKVEAGKLIKAIDENQDWYFKTPGYGDPIIYFKGRILVEYLVTFKHQSFDNILHQDLNEDSVFTDLKEWSIRNPPVY